MEKWILTWTKLAPLNQQTVDNLDDNLPGVYRLSYKADDDNYYVFYVGQSEDIKKRLLRHLSIYEENDRIKEYLRTKQCFFRLARITRGYLRDATEKAVYREYKPKCNYQEPDGRTDIEINLT